MVCVLEEGWNKALQGCGPPGTEFETPGLDDYILIEISLLRYEMRIESVLSFKHV